MHSWPEGGFIKAPKGKAPASQWPNQYLHIHLEHIIGCCPPKCTSHYLTFSNVCCHKPGPALMQWCCSGLSVGYFENINKALNLTLPASQTKSTFVCCHLAAITAHQNSFFCTSTMCYWAQGWVWGSIHTEQGSEVNRALWCGRWNFGKLSSLQDKRTKSKQCGTIKQTATRSSLDQMKVEELSASDGGGLKFSVWSGHFLGKYIEG